VSSLPSSVDTNHNTLPLINASPKPDVVSIEGKTRELAVVIKRGGRAGSGGSGGGRSHSRGVGRVVPIHTAGAGGTHSSSGSLKLVVGWLGISVLAGLLLSDSFCLFMYIHLVVWYAVYTVCKVSTISSYKRFSKLLGFQ
ncbi:unnamed protein product, partial [Brassica rapa subsp. trilocularis]